MTDTTALPDQLDADAFAYPVEVADAGPSKKRLSVTIPRSRIEEHTQEVFGDVRGDVQIPGFRRGKAPRHVVEKRLSKAVKDQVQSDLLRESYEQALQHDGLNAIGEPEFDKDAKLELPDSGDYTYNFNVEVRPDFDLPPMDELTVRKAKIAIKDEHVDQALENLRNQQGNLMPVENRPVKEGDYLVADVEVKVDDETVADQKDANLVARGGRILGVAVDDFGERVSGVKAGNELTFTIHVPDDHPSEKIKGKDASVHVTVKDIKELHPAEIDGPFLEGLGFENNDELMAALREQMEQRVEQDIQNAMRRQVQEYLAGKIDFALPEKMSARQIDRVVNRRAMDLLMRGMPQEQVRGMVEQLRQGADVEAQKELKMFFILDKAAADREVQVEEGEINGQIAMAAIERGERPETLRKRMEKDGSLTNLYVQTRERKTLDKLIEEAKIEEFEPTPEEQKQTVDDVTGGEESQDVT